MRCNIDARGKFRRLMIGVALLALAATDAALIAAGALPGGWWWLVVAAVAGAGAFGVFEYRAGWCLMRALGVRTPW